MNGVVLGAGGFVGGALMKELQRRGDVPVRGYCSRDLDLTSPESPNRLAGLVDEETILIVAVRSRRMSDPLVALAEEVAISACLAKCLALRRIQKIVYFSTVSVYGDVVTNLSVTEEAPIAPTSLYGISKFAAESIVRLAAEQREVPAVVLRPCKMYGPGDVSGAYGPARFLESILRKEEVRLYGDGSELRDHLFIHDLLSLTIGLTLGEASGIFNLATGRSHSFLEIMACLRGLTGFDFPVGEGERTRPKVDQGFDISKLLGALPGFRFTPLEEGLRQTHRYMAERHSAGL